MQVERKEKEIVIRISSDKDTEKLQEVLNLIRYGEITAKSTATATMVEEMTSDINKNWWKKNKSRFIK